MRPDCRLLSIEKIPSFSEALDAITDPRFTSEVGDAVDFMNLIDKHAFTRPDVIVSGIPFNTLSADGAQEIAQAIHTSLKPGGAFIAYQVRSDIDRSRARCERSSSSKVLSSRKTAIEITRFSQRS